MGLLDVTELLCDPLFIEDFTIERRIVENDDEGFQDEKSIIFSASGSIQADSGFTLSRHPELARIEGQMTVYTTWALTNGNGLIDADILIDSRGRRFTLTDVKDWGNYGAGYIQATLEVLDVGNNGAGGDESLPEEAGDDPFS
ncbi:hypothetical protein [Entomobacter blattae]|uniref:Head-tail adaptor protein n=1 Tax=Entomobacter blattae TaxID=2762277 RepID=A0A7H1NTY8_9PROT|nr:hypothetical protein [Entomobacter blattae]QNT79248.1 hypothetical protein JGUZn3_20430 [Entomobacter blattae]